MKYFIIFLSYKAETVSEMSNKLHPRNNANKLFTAKGDGKLHTKKNLSLHSL